MGSCHDEARKTKYIPSPMHIHTPSPAHTHPRPSPIYHTELSSYLSPYTYFLQLHVLGTAASVMQVSANSHPCPHFSLLVSGLCRFRIDDIKRETPFPVAAVTQLDYLFGKGIEPHYPSNNM